MGLLLYKSLKVVRNGGFDESSNSIEDHFPQSCNITAVTACPTIPTKGITNGGVVCKISKSWSGLKVQVGQQGVKIKSGSRVVWMGRHRILNLVG